MIYGIMLSSEHGDPSSVGYVDSDYSGDMDNTQSIYMICIYFSRRTYLLEIRCSIHNGHVDNWSRVHGGRWSCQRCLMNYKIGEIIGCWKS